MPVIDASIYLVFDGLTEDMRTEELTIGNV